METIILKGAPLSVNQLYTGRRFLTPKGKAAKEGMGWEAKLQYQGKPMKGSLSVVINFYFGDGRRHDLDNCLKATLDSLTGILWIDDVQIEQMIVSKYVDRGNPRVEVEVINL